MKAIEIKEKLLGKDDYEVALSLGHLGSLYTYDMKKYKEAIPLYMRSIKIGAHAVWLLDLCNNLIITDIVQMQ